MDVSKGDIIVFKGGDRVYGVLSVEQDEVVMRAKYPNFDFGNEIHRPTQFLDEKEFEVYDESVLDKIGGFTGAIHNTPSCGETLIKEKELKLLLLQIGIDIGPDWIDLLQQPNNLLSIANILQILMDYYDDRNEITDRWLTSIDVRTVDIEGNKISSFKCNKCGRIIDIDD